MQRRGIFAILLAIILAVMCSVPVLAATTVSIASDTRADRVIDEDSGTDYTLQNQVKVTNVIFKDGTVKFDMFWKWIGSGTYLGQTVNAAGKDQWIENTQAGEDGIFRTSQQAVGELGGQRFSYNLVIVHDGNGDINIQHEHLNGAEPP
jgi:hypothetical protein